MKLAKSFSLLVNQFRHKIALLCMVSRLACTIYGPIWDIQSIATILTTVYIIACTRPNLKSEIYINSIIVPLSVVAFFLAVAMGPTGNFCSSTVAVCTSGLKSDIAPSNT